FRAAAAALLDQGTAPLSMAEERPGVPAALGLPPRVRWGGRGRGDAGLPVFRPVRVRHLPAQRPAGSQRRPPPSAQAPAAFRLRRATAASGAAGDAAPGPALLRIGLGHIAAFRRRAALLPGDDAGLFLPLEARGHAGRGG